VDKLYLQAVHLVFIVSWFSALFYMVRLFIYATEAQKKEPAERDILTSQLLLMEKRLWNIIGWPAMFGTVITGIWMLSLNPAYYFSAPWMWLKLCCVILLVFYHLQCQRIYRRQRRLEFTLSSFRLRLFNELATVFLVAIVFLAVVKSTSGLLWGILGLTAFAAVLMLSVTIYRRASGKKEN
jgi:putative membrane protein